MARKLSRSQTAELLSANGTSEGNFLVKKILCRLQKSLPLTKKFAALKKVCRFILTTKWDTYFNRFWRNSSIRAHASRLAEGGADFHTSEFHE